MKLPNIKITPVLRTVQETNSTSALLTYAHVRLQGHVDGDAVVSLAGADADLFQLIQVSRFEHVLQLRAGVAIDFESSPRLEVEIVVHDAVHPWLGSQSAGFEIAVGNVGEAPSILSNGAGATAAIAVEENQGFVTTVEAADPEGGVVTYALSGGADQSLFSLADNGTLSFAAAPDFENPGDAGADNVYEVVVSAIDSSGLTDTQTLFVTVGDVVDANQITRIHAVQGSGEASVLAGQAVTIEGRVTAWFPNLKMFFVQEESEHQDADTETSEGVAVFYGNGVSPVDADSVGDVVRLQGTVTEFNGFTELTNPSGFVVRHDGTAADLDAATQVLLPIADGSTLERYEGMQVEVASQTGGDLFVADTFTFARFGEATLYADAVPFQYTEQHAPDVAGYAAYTDFLARNAIQIDDGSNQQNPTLTELNDGSRIVRDTTDDGVANGTPMGLDAAGNVNFIRAGDSTSSITGILGFGFGSYELHATQAIELTANARPAAPADLGDAEMQVASFNLLNYFTTLGTATFTNPDGVSHQGRGASTAAEFQQQQAKIVSAMLATGADVFGLNELQNNGFGPGSAIASLVNALNAAAGADRFAYISSPKTGTDAIMVGIVYDKTVVTPLGNAVNPDTSVYTAFAADNRLPVAQTFGYAGDATKQFTLVVNHLKSKGSAAGLPGDADQLDGQGASAATRLEAVKQLDAWLATDPTGATDGDYVLAGDLNSYSMETPVTELLARGWEAAAEAGDYSYVFDGLRGSLDHILTRGLESEITGFAHFNINADEQVALDYNDEFFPDDLDALDGTSMYRSSDHDPVVIGLKLASEAGSPLPPPADTIAPVLSSTSPADNAAAVPAGADIQLTFNEAVRRGTGEIKLVATDGSGAVIVLAESEIAVSGNTVTLDPLADLEAGKGYAVQMAAGAIEDLAGNDHAGVADLTTLNFTTAASTAGRPFISEIHYDNAGTDVGEGIGIQGAAGVSLAGWSVVLYNGSGGASYGTTMLSGSIDDEGGGIGEIAIVYASNGMQNGSPDGIALVDAGGTVVQFLSYEGVFAATNGAAAGLTSTDIGVSENGTEAIGGSLELVGGVWSKTADDSFGFLN